ncbi:hypothetical protein CNMCM8927_002225 [Aspergillus lentulus]|uniref:Wax synthase domain-containing protein n=1 Tax=Aspergillus lentulus TaxID=293939 RepID=A0AAN5YHS9_ASPLE|nr:hypothetical protein CNMCM8927_002225 [Aspergillus lentulus]
MVPGPNLKKYYMLALRPAKSLTHTSQGRIYFPGPKEKQLLVNLASSTDKRVHARKRRIISHAMSEAAIRSYEPTILDKTRLFCQRVSDPTTFKGPHKNMLWWFSFLSGAVRCFLVQPLGIMIEDAVQEAFRRFRGNTKQCSTLWTRLIGYLWVWGFLMSVAPLYNFPLFQYQNPTKNGVPFSVIKFVRELSG